MDEELDAVVAAFRNEDGAKEALRKLEQAHKNGLINIKDAAILRRDENNKLHITETADKGWGRGAVIGGVAGAVIGLVAGPIGWLTLGGAAVGGLAARLRDGGFQDRRLKEIADGLTPGSSAIVAIIEHKWLEQIEKQLRDDAADVVTQSIAADLANQLEAEGQAMQQGQTGTTEQGKSQAA